VILATLNTFNAAFWVTFVTKPFIGGCVGELGLVFISRYFLQDENPATANMMNIFLIMIFIQ
jgi:hypothetical protein